MRDNQSRWQHPQPTLAWLLVAFLLYAPHAEVRMSAMDEKQPGFWAEVWNWVNVNTPVISGALLAFLVAVARSRKEGEGLKSSLLEATLCGILSLGIISAFEYFGLPSNLATLFGVIIGFMGTKKLAEIIDSIIGRKIGSK